MADTPDVESTDAAQEDLHPRSSAKETFGVFADRTNLENLQEGPAVNDESESESDEISGSSGESLEIEFGRTDTSGQRATSPHSTAVHNNREQCDDAKNRPNCDDSPLDDDEDMLPSSPVEPNSQVACEDSVCNASGVDASNRKDMKSSVDSPVTGNLPDAPGSPPEPCLSGGEDGGEENLRKRHRKSSSLSHSGCSPYQSGKGSQNYSKLGFREANSPAQSGHGHLYPNPAGAYYSHGYYNQGHYNIHPYRTDLPPNSTAYGDHSSFYPGLSTPHSYLPIHCRSTIVTSPLKIERSKYVVLPKYLVLAYELSCLLVEGHSSVSKLKQRIRNTMEDALDLLDDSTVDSTAVDEAQRPITSGGSMLRYPSPSPVVTKRIRGRPACVSSYVPGRTRGIVDGRKRRGRRRRSPPLIPDEVLRPPTDVVDDGAGVDSAKDDIAGADTIESEEKTTALQESASHIKPERHGSDHSDYCSDGEHGESNQPASTELNVVKMQDSSLDGSANNSGGVRTVSADASDNPQPQYTCEQLNDMFPKVVGVHPYVSRNPKVCGRGQCGWQVGYTDNNGKRKTVLFSIAKLGMQESHRQAVAYRKYLVQQGYAKPKAKSSN